MLILENLLYFGPQFIKKFLVNSKSRYFLLCLVEIIHLITSVPSSQCITREGFELTRITMVDTKGEVC